MGMEGYVDHAHAGKTRIDFGLERFCVSGVQARLHRQPNGGGECYDMVIKVSAV
jgi:hypothetical protein